MKRFLKSGLLVVIFIMLINCCEIYSQPIVNNEDKDEYMKISREIVRTALTEKKGYGLLEELCNIGPRINGSEELEKAIQWAKSKMEEMGFDRVWLQPVKVPNWKRGNIERAEIINSREYKGKILSIAALGGSIGTSESGITGKVVEVQGFEELHNLKEKAEGKIIFFNRPMDKGEINTFSAYGSAVDQRIEGAIEAAKAGGFAAIARSVTTKYDNIPHLGLMTYRNGVTKVPAVSIGLIDADFLSDALKKEPYLELNIKLDCKNLDKVQSYNLIGEITGSEKPEEIIVVGGHFDCWDKGEGAHDDGGGCMQALEVLDMFKRLKLKPKRTVRCVLFVNEEQGGSGSIKYGEYAGESEEIHYAAVESDRGVFTPRGFYISAQAKVIRKIQSWMPYLKNAHIEWIKKGGSGPDINKIENTKALIGYVPDDERYFDVHHSANDVFETVHPREMELGTAAMAILVYLISEEGLE